MAQKHRTRLSYAPYIIKRLGEAIAVDELSVSRRMLGLDGPSYLANTRRVELVAMSRR